MKVAGRFKPCVHMGCFDLDVFVEMNQRSRKASPIKHDYFLNSLLWWYSIFRLLAIFNREILPSAVAMPHLSQELCFGEYHHRSVLQSHCVEGILLVYFLFITSLGFSLLQSYLKPPQTVAGLRRRCK